MSKITIKSQISADGDEFNCVRVRESVGGIKHVVPLPAAKAGTLSTRTDEDTGVATLAEGHGIESADVVDVYWAGGCRHGMAATVDGNDVTIDGGAGDDLPEEDTVVSVAKQTAIDTDFDGDKVTYILAATDRGPCHVDFQTAVPASVYAFPVAAEDESHWDAESGLANPLAAATIDAIKVSNGDPLNAATLRIVVQYASTS
jgi:hypothetical protein